MSRIFLIGAASLAALTAAAGTVSIMAIDLLGASFIEKIKFIGEHPRGDVVPKELKGTKDITYFKTVKVDGKPFSITMGISFATPEDLASGKQKSRWCYTTIKPADGGVPRQIELATQEGAKLPRYNDLAAYAAGELAVLGETMESLATIARKHCVFTKEPGGPGSLVRRFTTIVLKGEMGEGDRS
ncbi:MAG: hypothetical protein WC807_20165 [Hyphomicrobium sp.]|jgi:hypothetical protein